MLSINPNRNYITFESIYHSFAAVFHFLVLTKLNPFIIILLTIFLLNLIQIVIHMPLYQLINLLFTLLFGYFLFIANNGNV